MDARIERALITGGAALLIATHLPCRAAGQQKGETNAQVISLSQEVEVLKSELSLAEATARSSAADLEARIAALETALAQSEAARAAAEAEAGARESDQDQSMAAIREETLAVTRRLDAQEAHPVAGYDGGWYLRTRGGALALTLNGFLRTRYGLSLERQFDSTETGYVRAADPPRDAADRVVLQNGFAIQNARLILAIRLLEKLRMIGSIDYGVAADAPVYSKRFEDPTASDLLGDRPLSPRLRALDLYGAFTPLDGLTIRAGQLKVPFDKESRFTPLELPFASGSILMRRYRLYGDVPRLDRAAPYYRRPYEVMRAARFGRDVGASIQGLLLADRLDLHAGVFNGSGVGMENDNRDILAALRIEGRPFGDMGEGSTDAAVSDRLRLALGAGLAFDLLEHQTPYDPGRQYNSADLSATVDVHVKWRGLSGLGAFFFRYADHGGAVFEVSDGALTEAPVNSLGGSVQLAYYHQGTRLQPAIRYAVFDPRMDRSADHVHQTTVALRYTVIPNHLRLCLDYTGIIPADRMQSYLAPRPSWVDPRHDITVTAEIFF